MKRVKQLMNEYLHYIKTEKDNYKKAVQANYEAMKRTNQYTDQYLEEYLKVSLQEQEKIFKQNVEAKRPEYLKKINEILDSKLSGVEKPDTTAAEYQAAVSNIFTKVQLLGRTLTPELLGEILQPAIAKQDNSTIEAVRSCIDAMANIPGGQSAKTQLLCSVPRVVNQVDALQNAKKDINNSFNEFGDNLNSSVVMTYLEQTGVFEL